MIDQSDNHTDLNRKYRPRKWSEVLGQDEAVALLREKVRQNKIPHGVLFSGPSGVGKTTLAWILASKIGCGGGGDFTEINAADSRGIDTIREMGSRIMLSASSGICRVWVWDEVHMMTNDAQTAMLKYLEKCPSHVYFFLCTTNPSKIQEPLKNRCELKIHLNSLSEEHLQTIVKKVAILEGTTISDQLISKVVENADGCGRDAIGLLSQALTFTEEEARLKAVVRKDVKATSWDLVQALCYQKKAWKDVAEILKKLQNEDAEQVRRLILANGLSMLLKGDQAGYNLICLFESTTPLHTGKAGHASIARACWEFSKKK